MKINNIITYLVLLIFILSSCHPTHRISKTENLVEMAKPKMDHSKIKTPYSGEVFSHDEVTEMVRFPGCENNALVDEQLRSCSTEKMLRYMYSNLNYPAIARENNVQGTVILEFIITPEGHIRSAKINKEPGAGTGNAAMDMLAKMEEEHTWIPAKLNGNKVAIIYLLPVKFKLA